MKEMIKHAFRRPGVPVLLCVYGVPPLGANLIFISYFPQQGIKFFLSTIVVMIVLLLWDPFKLIPPVPVVSEKKQTEIVVWRNEDWHHVACLSGDPCEGDPTVAGWETEQEAIGALVLDKPDRFSVRRCS